MAQYNKQWPKLVKEMKDQAHFWSVDQTISLGIQCD